MTHMLAGSCGLMLSADLGAEAIKIEDSQGRDPTRGLGPPFARAESGYCVGLDRTKRSVALDLPRAERGQVLYDLVGIADVVFSSFRLGSVKRLGCDYESLKETEPQIIYRSLTGFSETGPCGDRPALDLVTQALSGT